MIIWMFVCTTIYSYQHGEGNQSCYHSNGTSFDSLQPFYFYISVKNKEYELIFRPIARQEIMPKIQLFPFEICRIKKLLKLSKICTKFQHFIVEHINLSLCVDHEVM